MHRRLVPLPIAIALVMAACGTQPDQHTFTEPRGQQLVSETPTSAAVAPGYAMVILADPPLADWPGVARAKNGKIDFSSGANGRYVAALAQAHNAFKKWLQSTKSPAQILREYDVVLNGFGVQLNGATIDSLRTGPGVAVVEPSYLYHQTMNRSVGIIGAPVAWSMLSGVANAGAGVKVGVIDSGIDENHPYLTDGSLCATTPSGFPKFDPGNQGLTSCKVIVARVYYTGRPGLYTAEAAQDHGTHVSGTIAGVYGTIAPAAGLYPAVTGLTGVAPKAFLGNYNVFPGPITSATSHDIAEAIEDAVKDGMDVLNMSLGGGINGLMDQLTAATDRATRAGVVVAVAAGNSGSNPNTVESPGQAAGAITAAAASNNHYFGADVAVDGAHYGAATGEFNPFDPAVTAPLANWNGTAAGATAGAATQGCAALAGGTHAGQIVIIDRGTCTFAIKVANAKAAGAVGVLVVNNGPGDPIAMAGTDSIPAVMLGLSDRAAIRTAGAAGATATVNGTTLTEVLTANENYLASFSSRGPTNLLDVKPDVTAPGVNIYSSIVGGKYEMFQGTSMATPHVAGSAALLRQLHPDWAPAQIKSALVDSASRPTALGTSNPQNRGGGVVNLAAAAHVTATLDPATLSFRKIEPTSGQSKTIVVQVTNVTGTSVTYGATASFASAGMAANATVSVSPSSLTLDPGKTGSVAVTVETAQSAPVGQYYGDLTVTGGGSTLKAPFWFAVRTYVDAGPLY